MSYQALPSNNRDEEGFSAHLNYFSGKKVGDYTLFEYHRLVEFVKLCLRLGEIDHAATYSEMGWKIFRTPDLYSIKQVRAQVLIERKRFPEAVKLLVELETYFREQHRRGNDNYFYELAQIQQQFRQCSK